MLTKAMQEAFGINMCGSAVTFAALLRLFRAAGLRWEMHPAQLFSVEMQSSFLDSTATAVSTVVPEEEATELLKVGLKHTLMGIPVALRPDYPERWIRLYSGNKLVAYMESLAIPAEFGSYPEALEAHEQSEDAKAQKIWEADNA
jgi:hypothetical protein